MTAAIYIPPAMQALVNGIDRIDVSGDTIGECLNEMVKKYPQFNPKLFPQRGKLRNGTQIFLNEKDAYPEPLSRPVRDGDKIYIFNIVLGG
jgi:molybdopterin converting factor small subunit